MKKFLMARIGDVDTISRHAINTPKLLPTVNHVILRSPSILQDKLRDEESLDHRLKTQDEEEILRSYLALPRKEPWSKQ